MTQSQHYAGVAFDVRQRLSNAERNRQRNLARESGAWSYVKPANLTPTWVHFDKRFGRPAYGTERTSATKDKNNPLFNQYVKERGNQV